MDETVPVLAPEILEGLKRKIRGNFLLLVNGKLSRAHSRITEEIDVMDIGEAILTRPERVQPYLGRCAASFADAFYLLNTAFFRSGLLVHVPENLTLKEPVHVVFFTDTAKKRAVFYPRNLIVAGAGSKAVLVETHVSGSGRCYFENSVTEIILEKGAILDHAKIQTGGKEDFYIASTHALQRHSSSFSSFSLLTGSRLTRNENRVILDDEGAACTLNGLYLGDKDQVLDQQTFVDHRKPNGKSRQLFKGLLAGNSRGVFNGRVIVRQDAQRTDAQQNHKALLLSDGAKVDTQPQLEILADDVKCSHGTAVGRLQEDALFYLRSRGIGEKEAGQILAQGFAREVIERLELEFLKETLLELVNEKLTQQFGGGKE
jgi:Fe-S cluster assembly protein SufD